MISSPELSVAVASGAVHVAADVVGTSAPSPLITGAMSSEALETVTETANVPVLSEASVALTTKVYSPASDASTKVTVPSAEISNSAESSPERVQVTPSSEV